MDREARGSRLPEGCRAAAGGEGRPGPVSAGLPEVHQRPPGRAEPRSQGGQGQARTGKGRSVCNLSSSYEGH